MRTDLFSTIGGVDGGECDRPTNFGVWPSQVDDFKRRLAPFGRNFNETVKTCAKMPANEKSAWDDFYRGFAAFVNKPTALFGAYQEWVTACTDAHTLDAWQVKIESYCPVIGPRNVQGANLTAAALLTVGVVAAAGIVAIVAFGPSLATGAKALVSRFKR